MLPFLLYILIIALWVGLSIYTDKGFVETDRDNSFIPKKQMASFEKNLEEEY